MKMLKFAIYYISYISYISFNIFATIFLFLIFVLACLVCIGTVVGTFACALVWVFWAGIIMDLWKDSIKNMKKFRAFLDI